MRRARQSPPRPLPPAPGARRTPRRGGSGPVGPAMLTTICAVGAALGLLACASTATETSTKTAVEAPEQTRDSAGDEATTAAETELRTVEDGTDAAAGDTVSASDDAMVILSGGERRESDEPATLAEAAAAAQAQRAASGPPVATITDENRDERAERGQLTFVSAPAAGAAPDPSAGEEETAPAAKPDGEAYWRTTVRDARVRWRDAEQQVEELQARVAELRNAFYAADDPFYREGVIKADWDAALGDLATAKAEVAAARTDLRRLLGAGRRAGALPGWLREGLELEPDPPRERDAEPSTVEPVEPTMVEEGGRR